MAVFGPDQGMETGGPAPRGRDGARNARHSYLVGRLQNRQLTMEEAAELFAIMQGMLQTSEAARLALMRASRQPVTTGHVAPPPRPPPPPGSGSSDDLLLVGLLAMGAGAGLLAAMTKRIQEATTPAPSAPNSDPPPATSSRKG